LRSDFRDRLGHRADAAVDAVGRWSTRLNSVRLPAYLSYVPDSIRYHGRFPNYPRLVKEWTADKTRNNGGDLPRLLFLMQNTEQILAERVDGDFAELGVHLGYSAAVLAGLASRDGKRRLHLFDTFEGFDQRDLQGVDSAVPKELFEDTSLPAVRKRVGHDDICVYYPGYFPESAGPVDPNTRFALVHLDCDLYTPTAAGLEFFYPRMEPGGLIVLHDYSNGFWPGIRQAADEFLADKPERLILAPDKSGTAAVRRSH
jgi:Macrocin-O-methyltransferase (TylF)